MKDHAAMARDYANRAVDSQQRRMPGSAELFVKIAMAHSLAAIATLLAEGIVEVQVADTPAPDHPEEPGASPALGETSVVVVPGRPMPKAGIYQVIPAGDELHLRRLGER